MHRAHTRGGVGVAAGVLLEQRDELGWCLRGEVVAGHDDQWQREQAGHRGEGLDRVETHLRLQVLGDQQRAVAQHQRVAVGRGARHGVAGDQSGRAGAVVHHHLLAQQFGQARRNQARHRVHAAASGVAHHQADRARGPVLRRGTGGHAGGGESGQQRGDQSAAAGRGWAGRVVHVLSPVLVVGIAVRPCRRRASRAVARVRPVARGWV